MRVKSLKIATVEGRFVKVGDEFELNDNDAKKYIEAGFVKELDVKAQESEPEVQESEPKAQEAKTATKTRAK